MCVAAPCDGAKGTRPLVNKAFAMGRRTCLPRHLLPLHLVETTPNPKPNALHHIPCRHPPSCQFTTRAMHDQRVTCLTSVPVRLPYTYSLYQCTRIATLNPKPQTGDITTHILTVPVHNQRSVHRSATPTALTPWYPHLTHHSATLMSHPTALTRPAPSCCGARRGSCRAGRGSPAACMHELPLRRCTFHPRRPPQTV